MTPPLEFAWRVLVLFKRAVAEARLFSGDSVGELGIPLGGPVTALYVCSAAYGVS